MVTQTKAAPALRFPPRRGCNRSMPAHQRGIALVVSLILLIVITLVGLAAVRGTIMQQKMTANFYDREIAFQANEGALRTAEEVIRASTNPKDFRDCTADGLSCHANPFAPGAGVSTSDIVNVSRADFDAGKLSAGQPQYVIEYMGRFSVPDSTVKNVSTCSGYLPCPSSNNAGFYRITARSGQDSGPDSGPDSGKGRASVTLQSTFRK